MPLIHNESYLEQARSRYPGQYVGKPRFDAVVRAFANECQQAEDAFWGLIIGSELQRRQSPINARATFNGTDSATFVWPIPFKDTTYEIIAGNAVNIGAPAIIGANLDGDGTTKTTKGIKVFATAAFTGWVDAWAYEAGANPLIPILRGDLLDKIGKIVGQKRNNSGDSEYLILITARIAANRSDGRRESLIRLASLLVPGAAIYVKDYPPASVYVAPQAPITINPYIAAQFMESATAAGVYLMFGWTTADLANTLTLGYSVANGTTVPTTAQSPGYSVTPIAGGALGGVIAA